LLLSLLLIVTLPVHLIGLIGNYIPYKLCDVMTKNVKDPQFLSTYRFVLAMGLFFINYLIIFIVSLVFTDLVWFKYFTLLSIPVFGLLSFSWWISFLKLRGKFKFWSLKIKKHEGLNTLKKLRKEIFANLETILK